MTGDLSSDKASDRNALGNPINQHQVQHFGCSEHLTISLPDLTRQGLIGSKQELLAGLPACVKGPGNLSPAERSICQEPAILAREWNSLSHALINDIGAHLGQPIDIGFSGSKITALNRVVEKPVDAVAVILIVLGGIDSSLSSNTMSAARTVMKAKALDLVAQLGQRSCSRGSRQTGTDND